MALITFHFFQASNFIFRYEPYTPQRDLLLSSVQDLIQLFNLLIKYRFSHVIFVGVKSC